jgi:hypothetical protein
MNLMTCVTPAKTQIRRHSVSSGLSRKSFKREVHKDWLATGPIHKHFLGRLSVMAKSEGKDTASARTYRAAETRARRDSCEATTLTRVRQSHTARRVNL